MLYVVMAENGEYSDRDVWVSAAYHSEAKAQAALQEAVARRGAWDQWSASWDRERAKIAESPKYNQLAQTLGFRSILDIPEYAQELDEAATAALPPRPPEEGGERFWIIKIEVGVWTSARPDDAP